MATLRRSRSVRAKYPPKSDLGPPKARVRSKVSRNTSASRLVHGFSVFAARYPCKAVNSSSVIRSCRIMPVPLRRFGPNRSRTALVCARGRDSATRQRWGEHWIRLPSGEVEFPGLRDAARDNQRGLRSRHIAGQHAFAARDCLPGPGTKFARWNLRSWPAGCSLPGAPGCRAPHTARA